MNHRSDDSFRIKPSAPKGREAPRARSFLSQVAFEIGKAGDDVGRLHGSARRRGAKRGRGWVAARLMDSDSGTRFRRVIIKTRLVVLNQAGSRSVASHLRYIVRDGVSRDGLPAHAYGAEADAADVKAFEERGRDDRHQFRFIVAPEDGVELQDLRDFTRHLMKRMEGDLGTRLEWIAVDHWDTDNPHTHVILRGKDQTGGNLVIGREYISKGMRMRAGELATEWLGPRTDLEMQASLRRDVDQERWTGLDRELHALAKEGVVDLSVVPDSLGDLRRRALLLGRLQRLQSMGLAAQIDPGRWKVREDAQIVLRQLGERRDIIRTMQRAFGSEGREFAIKSDALPDSVVGRIAAKGLAGELHDKPYLVIDGLDGRGHYVNLPRTVDLAELPVGGIVEVRAGVESIADRNVAAIARDGSYLRRQHLTQLLSSGRSRVDAEDIVAGHIRRLEALRRAGIVERISDGFWKVPANLVERGIAYDRARLGDMSVKLRSHLPVEKQVQAIGATWLDQQILEPTTFAATNMGFAAAAQQARDARVDFLIKEGLAERRNTRVILAGNLLDTLRTREIESAAKAIAAKTGLIHQPAVAGAQVSGIYRRSVMLASGRFAVLDNGLGFALVPWRPVIETALGRRIAAVVRGDQVSWQLGRQRGISL